MQYPKKGGIIIADAEPHAGHEMGGHNASIGNIRRHYVVMSTDEYNSATHMFIGMPITTSERYQNNPRYMPILINGAKSTGVKGYIVLWQLQNFDFEAGNGKVINHIDKKTIDRLQEFVDSMVG